MDIDMDAKSNARTLLGKVDRWWTDSHYIENLMWNRCAELLQISDIGPVDTIDLLMSLHILMEAHINGLFRDMALTGLKKDIDNARVAKNIDKIDFKDKVTSYIYYTNFDFGEELAEAAGHHSVIERLIKFCESRNRIVHGHAISMYSHGENLTHSGLSSQLEDNKAIRKQLKLYTEICNDLEFFIRHSTQLSPEDKHRYIERYLATDFIPADLLIDK